MSNNDEKMDVEINTNIDENVNENVNEDINEKNNLNMDIETPYERDYFLWISHGTTITDNYYRFETVTRIPKLLFYTTHGRFLTADVTNLTSYIHCDPKLSYSNLLKYIPPFEVVDPSNLGVRENIIGEIINETYYAISLPPLLYSVNTYNAEHPPFVNVIGLYHFRINEDEKEMRLVEKVLGWYDIEREININPNKVNYLTYSKIEGFIKGYVTRYNERYDNQLTPLKKGDHKISIDICSLGIFTCRSFSPSYSSKVSTLETSPADVYVYKNISDFTKPEKFNEIITGDSGCLEMLGFDILEEEVLNKISEWEGALAEIEYQGCAFNVLNFYGVLDEEISRSLAVCIPATGTSIFSFVDYLNHEIIKRHKRILKYLVLRFTIQGLFDFLEECVNTGVLTTSMWIPIKLYKEDVTENNKKNLVGHFVSLWFNPKEKLFHLIDPQAELYISLNADKKKYMETRGFQFADIVVMTDVNPSKPCDNKLLSIVTGLINNNTTSVHLRPDELLWGGERATKFDEDKPLLINENLVKEDKSLVINDNRMMNKEKEIQNQSQSQSQNISEEELNKQINDILKRLLETEQIEAVSFQEFSEKFPEDELYKLVKMDNQIPEQIPEQVSEQIPEQPLVQGGKSKTYKKQKNVNHFTKKYNIKKDKLTKKQYLLKKHKKSYKK